MEQAASSVRVLIVYYSRFGVLKSLADLIAEGARQVANVDVDLLEVEDRPIEELLPGESEDDMRRRRAVTLNRLVTADALVVGSPAYFGSMASPVKRLFEDCATASLPSTTDRSRPWRGHVFRNKIGAAFTASATPHGGNEQTLHSILTMMMHLGMILVMPGQRVPILERDDAPYGVTATSGPEGDRPLDEQTEEFARDLGRQVAEVTTWIRWGRERWDEQRRARERAAATPSGPFDPSA